MSKHGHNQVNTGEVKENPQPGVDVAQNPHSGSDEKAGGEPENSKIPDLGQTDFDPEKFALMTLEEKLLVLEAELAKAEQSKAELEARLAESNDQYLRKAADFENFRKRTIREKQDLVDFANQNLLLDLLPVMDDFERAIKSAETSKDFTGFYNGITMIEKGLSTLLENKWALKRFDSAGEVFDPNRHEAIQMEKAEGISEAVVKEDYVKGYFLKDRVIRFAKVKVLMPEEANAKNSAE